MQSFVCKNKQASHCGGRFHGAPQRPLKKEPTSHFDIVISVIIHGIIVVTVMSGGNIQLKIAYLNIYNYYSISFFQEPESKLIHHGEPLFLAEPLKP